MKKFKLYWTPMESEDWERQEIEATSYEEAEEILEDITGGFYDDYHIVESE